MDNKGQNKQKNFWTVFAIVVAIFAILLATGVIERGPQPQAAEHAEDAEKDACKNECGGDATCQEQGGSCKEVEIKDISLWLKAGQALGIWMPPPPPCDKYEEGDDYDNPKNACNDDQKCKWFPESACVCENCSNRCNEEVGTVCNKDTGQCDCAPKDDDDDDDKVTCQTACDEGFVCKKCSSWGGENVGMCLKPDQNCPLTFM
jgi:hypothetical protein